MQRLAARWRRLKRLDMAIDDAGPPKRQDPKKVAQRWNKRSTEKYVGVWLSDCLVWVSSSLSGA